MTTNSTVADTAVEIETSRLLNLRPSDLELLKSAAADPAGRETIRRHVLVALSGIDGRTAEGAYEAFLLGAHMRHVFDHGDNRFAGFRAESMTLGDRYFLEGISGRRFRVLDDDALRRTGTSIITVGRTVYVTIGEGRVENRRLREASRHAREQMVRAI